MRMTFLNPEEILKEIELRDDMTVADFGCGSGGFTFPIAKKVKNGLVYAVDIQELPLSALKGRAEMENLNNIEFVHSDIEKNIRIPEASLDIIMMANVLFQIEDKKSVFQIAKKLLKNNGKIFVIDWKEKVGLGSSKEEIAVEKIEEIFREEGFKLEKKFDAGMYHYGIILNKIN